MLPSIRHNLNVMCEYYGIELEHHKAESDSRACGEILLRYIDAGVCGSSQSLHFLIDVGVEVGQRIGGFLYLPVDPDRLPDQGVDVRQG